MVAGEAVQAAKEYILEVFKDEEIARVGLEELELKDAIWKVTIGFQRSWRTDSSDPLPRVLFPPLKTDRIYKTVQIRDDDGSVISLKHRDMSVPA